MFILIVFTDDEYIRFKARDPKIFETIYKEYGKKIYNFILIKTNGNVFLTEEVFSDTFYVAIKKASFLKNMDKIHSWLLKIAQNQLIDHIRKEKNRDKYIESSKEVNDLIEDKVEKNIFEKEKFLVLKTALENIKPEYSNILKMKYLEKKSQKDISYAINKSVSAVETILVRARKSLKKEIIKLTKDF